MKLLLDKHLGSGWLEDHDNPAIWELIEKIPARYSFSIELTKWKWI
jgi:hypothetical protein